MFARTSAATSTETRGITVLSSLNFVYFLIINKNLSVIKDIEEIISLNCLQLNPFKNAVVINFIYYKLLLF